MNKEKAYITKYNNSFLVLIPVYYECEPDPAWRKYFTGTKKECENILTAAPDYLNATPDENRQNRHNKILEYNFYMDRGQKEKAAAIKAQYNL
jgi:hypothetical protein